LSPLPKKEGVDTALILKQPKIHEFSKVLLRSINPENPG